MAKTENRVYCVTFALAVWITCITPVAKAAMCSHTKDVRESYDEAGAVLIGKVIHRDKFASRYIIQTSRVFKGNVPAEFTVTSMNSAELQLADGEIYLIYARHIDNKGRASIDACSRTSPKRFAARDIQELERLSSVNTNHKP